MKKRRQEKQENRIEAGERRARAELLAPAGSFESLKAAVSAGADAVYIGGSRFGARAYADNLDEERMLEAIDYAHLHGAALYMTVNTLLKEKELEGLYDYLAPYYERGLDAVIVQDLGVLTAVRRWFPDLHIHASTQMTLTGAAGARLLKELGAVRVVAARELSLAELRDIHENVDIEIESFIHGAMCYCYSGQCLLSSLIGGRSGNRGRCAQPCRLPYDVIGGADAVPGMASRTGAATGIASGADCGGKRTEARKGSACQGSAAEPYLNGRNERYVMSLKDLCTLDILPDILESGVFSLKIEGRMKSPEYTAGVVSIYRKYLDLYLRGGRGTYRVDDADRQILLKLFDRGGQTDGYYRKHNGKDMLVLKEKPEFRQTDKELIDYLDRTYVDAPVTETICGSLTAKAGEPLTLSLWPEGAEGETVTVTGAIVQPAKNQPVTAERIDSQLRKTGGTPFEFASLAIRTDGELFVPLKALNELRREGLIKLQEALLRPYRRTPDDATECGEKYGKEYGETCGKERRQGQSALHASHIAEEDAFPPAAGRESGKSAAGRPILHALVSDAGQFAAAAAEKEIAEIQIEADALPQAEWQSAVRRCHDAGKDCVLAMPVICRTDAAEFFAGSAGRLCGAGFDGFLVRSLEEPDLLKRLYAENGGGRLPPLYADHNLYAFNRLAAKTLAGLGFQRLTCPLELNAGELWSLTEMPQTFELIAYGYLPVMTTAQCVRRTVSGCDKKPGFLALKDRTGKKLPVYNHCAFCYNTIYNPLPLSLLGMEDTVRSLRPAALRLQFLNETPQELSEVVRAYAGALQTPGPHGDMSRELQLPAQRVNMSRTSQAPVPHGDMSRIPHTPGPHGNEIFAGRPGGYTRGHMKRGVE